MAGTKNNLVMTEALIHRNGKVCLGQKKKNGFAAGKWLGFGGKLEPEESIEDAMIREFFEETGSKVLNYKKRGVLTFHYTDDPDMEVHYFEVLEYKNEPSDSLEMAVGWFKIKDIPYDKMFPNDRFWLPMFLEKRFFEGEFSFNKNYQIEKYWIKERTDSQ